MQPLPPYGLLHRADYQPMLTPVQEKDGDDDAMNKEQFWNIVNEVHSSTDPRNQKEVLTALRDRLRNLPSGGDTGWKQIFRFYQDAARRNDLWAASAAMGAHSSDDGFMDFRSWLISQGARCVHVRAQSPLSPLVSVQHGRTGAQF